MSIIDTIIQKVTGEAGAGSAADPALLGHLTDLVNSPETGGLQGLIQKFQGHGLGDIVGSWMGPGENQAISGDLIAKVIGQDRLTAIASKFGIQPDQVSNLVAQHLPGVISKLSSTTTKV
jgi:uncharacterized protein YidB (DUF937 family)